MTLTIDHIDDMIIVIILITLILIILITWIILIILIILITVIALIIFITLINRLTNRIVNYTLLSLVLFIIFAYCEIHGDHVMRNCSSWIFPRDVEVITHRVLYIVRGVVDPKRLEEYLYSAVMNHLISLYIKLKSIN